jgi:hypothetical protein
LNELKQVGTACQQGKESSSTFWPKAFSRKTVGAAGFEPAISWSQARRISRLSYAPNDQREDWCLSRSAKARLQRRKEGESNPQGFTLAPLATECHRQLACPSSNRRRPHSGPYGRTESAQRESNPHFRLGKAVGYRYIMGTVHRGRIVKDSESTRWDSNPRFRVTKAESSPLDHQCTIRSELRVGPEGLEPSPTWLRARRAAANTSVPFSFIIAIDPGGVEPPSRGYQPRVLPLNHESSQPQVFRSDQGGRIRTDVLRFPKPADSPGSPTP